MCNMTCPGQIPSTVPCQSWPPDNPHPLDWLYDSLSSPPVAGVWWAHWHRCPVEAVASSKWMLHTGGGWGETPPHMIVKRFGCTTINKNRYINASFIHSYTSNHYRSLVWWVSLVSLLGNIVDTWYGRCLVGCRQLISFLFNWTLTVTVTVERKLENLEAQNQRPKFILIKW